MKNRILTAFAAVAFLLSASCSSDDATATFIDANGNVGKRYMKSVQTTSSDSSSDNKTLTITYDANGRVTNAFDGTQSSTFTYENGGLTNVTGTNDVLIINDLFQAPYDGLEYGDVLEYDSYGNPVEVRLYERDWNGAIIAQYTGEITYDAKPNPYFYTLEAAGIIAVLDNVELNFSMTPQSEELIKAKMLLPVNNPKKLVIKDIDGNMKAQIVADYVYDSTNYPTYATFTETSENSVKVYTAAYTYKQ